MANDITWSQLQTEIGVSGAIQIAAGVITINASVLTGDTYASINDDGVIEFVRKLVEKCYLTQVRINQGIEIGQRLSSFTAANLGTPTKDSDGILRLTSTQQIVSRLTINDNEVVGSQN